MQPRPVATQRFHNMTEGVAVIENRPQPSSFSSAATTRALAAPDRSSRLIKCVFAKPFSATRIADRFKVFEQIRIAEDSILDHFRHPGAEFTFRQGGQGVRVHQHERRLVKGTDRGSCRRDDSPRSCPRIEGVHHRQQGGRNLHHSDSAQPCGRSEPGHIAHHPSTEGEHQ